MEKKKKKGVLQLASTSSLGRQLRAEDSWPPVPPPHGADARAQRPGAEQRLRHALWGHPAARSPLQTADEEAALLGRGRGRGHAPSPFKQPALGVRYLLSLLSLQDLELLHLSRGEHKEEK